MKKKRSSILPKKLNELDCLINKAFISQPDSPSNVEYIHADIEHSLMFVKNLLSAEMASHPARQSYLENMADRVRELEAMYRGYGTGSSTTVSTIDHVDNVVDDADDDDHASNCTCAKPGIQEDDVSDDLESTLGQDTGVFVDFIEEKEAMPVTVFNNVLFEEKVDDDRDVHDDHRVQDEFRDRVEYVLFDDMSHNGASVEDEKEEKEIRAEVDLKESEKKKHGLGFGKLFGAVVSGFVIGMFSMALMLVSLDYNGYEGQEHFCTPT